MSKKFADPKLIKKNEAVENNNRDAIKEHIMKEAAKKKDLFKNRQIVNLPVTSGGSIKKLHK